MLDGERMTRYLSTLPMHPVRIGYLPVCSEAREGVQIGAAEIHCVIFTPRRMSASMCGVDTLVAPKAATSE